MKYTKPLTPTLRRQINESTERQMVELNECQNTAFVSALKTGLKATSTLINGLPDGFPIPMDDGR